jgi:hypothetical protein
MKNFLYHIILFFFPIVTLAYFIDVFISNCLKKSNTKDCQEYTSWNAIIEGKLDAEILIYGTSRARGNLVPSIIEKEFGMNVYNLGIDGHNIHIQNLRHRLALKYNAKPKLIIQTVDIETIEKGKLFVSDQFLPYMLWDNEFKTTLSKYEGFSRYDYTLPLVRYYGKFYTIRTAMKSFLIPKSNLKERVEGFQANTPPVWKNPFNNPNLSINVFDVKIDSPALALFDAYLRSCKENNLDVVIVFPPTYYKMTDLISNHKDIVTIYNQLAKKYDYNFIDYTQDSICFDQKYFTNATHLNETGANLYSQILSQKIKRIRN